MLIIPGHLKRQGKACPGFSNGCEIGIEILSIFFGGFACCFLRAFLCVKFHIDFGEVLIKYLHADKEFSNGLWWCFYQIIACIGTLAESSCPPLGGEGVVNHRRAVWDSFSFVWWPRSLVGSICGVGGVELWKSIYELTQEFQH